MNADATSPSPPTTDGRPAKPPPSFWQRRKKWILLSLVLGLCCCCGCPSLLFVPLMHGSRQIARVQDALEPGMTAGEVLEHADRITLTRFGVTHLFAFPLERTSATPGEGEAMGTCGPSVLAWEIGQPQLTMDGSPTTPSEAGARISGCDEIRFSAVILMSRLAFTVTLEDRKVKDVGSIRKTQ